MQKSSTRFFTGRRLTALLLAAALVLSMTACGGKDDGTGGQEKAKEWAYVPEFLTIEEENVSFYDMKQAGDKLYYVSWSYDEETGTSGQKLYYYSLTDRKTEQISLTWPEGVEERSIHSFALADDGSLYSYMSIYSDTEGEKQYISKFDAGGSWQFTKDLAEGRSGGDEISYVQNMITDAQGRLYLSGSDGVVELYDTDVGYVGSVSLGSGDIWVEEICRGGDGKVYIVYNSYDGNGSSTYLAEIDFEGKKVGNSYGNFPGSARYVVAGENGSFFISNETSVYEYDPEKQQKTLLFDWLDCDINGNYVESFGWLEDGRLVAVIEDWVTDDSGIALLTRKKASEVPQKENITIATMSGGYQLRALAVQFNKANDKYHVNVKQYIDYDNYNENSLSDALTNLNNDITSSNTPDIIDLGNLSVEQLAAKGVFEDLSGYLDASSVLQRSDILENILEAYTYDEKLVSIPAVFTLQTIIGHKSKLGDKKGWTIEEMIAYADANPDAELFDLLSKSELLQGLLMMNSESFIDWGTGECSFDTDTFKKLLEFANRYPEETEYNEDTPVTPIRIQRGEVLLYTEGIYDFRTIQEALSIFDGDAVCIGYPTVDGSSGSVMSCNYAYAIASKSDCKDGAWAFIESILTDDNENAYRNGFPTIKSKLDAMAADAVKVEYVLDENGEPYLDANGEPIIQGVGGGIGWGDWFYEYHLPTQEEVDIVMELMKEAKPISFEGNEQVLSIVLEEAEPFFKGQKSVDEVADIIQNRAKIYIDENR